MSATLLFIKQLELQIERMLLDPRDLDRADGVDFVRWNLLALEDELHEALNEVDWKPWTMDRGNMWRDIDAFRSELVDALHFFLNLYMVSFAPGTTPEQMAADLMRRYLAKNEVNRRRQEQGYDGVTGKCPECKRSWDDPTTWTVICSIPAAAQCKCGHDMTPEEVEWLRARQ